MTYGNSQSEQESGNPPQSENGARYYVFSSRCTTGDCRLNSPTSQSNLGCCGDFETMVSLQVQKSENPCSKHGSEKAIGIGGFVVPIAYHNLPLFCKSLFCCSDSRYNKTVRKAFEDVSNVVQTYRGLFVATLAQIFYSRVGTSKSSRIAKNPQRAIIFQRCNECFT